MLINYESALFHERRRQQFLYEDLYEKTRENLLLLIDGTKKIRRPLIQL